MNIEQKIESLEGEMGLVKGEIKQTLVDLKDFIMKQGAPFAVAGDHSQTNRRDTNAGTDSIKTRAISNEAQQGFEDESLTQNRPDKRLPNIDQEPGILTPSDIRKILDQSKASERQRTTARNVDDYHSPSKLRTNTANRPNSSGDLDNKFLKEDKKAGKSLLVLISSDRGLCGSYNAGLFRLIEKQDFLQKDVIKLFVGKKGQDYFKEDSFGEEIFSVDEKNYKAVSENVTNKFLKPFLDGQFDEVYIAYNKFVSAITQVPTITKVLPINLEYTKDGSEAVGSDILIEPDPNLFIETVFPKFLNLTVSSLLLESVTSEHAARTAAMDSATRNADEIIKETTMLFNKTRQAYITTELMDIVNGAEAIK